MSAPLLEQRLITVEEYHLMAEAGILDEDDRIELIEGKLITRSPVGGPHIEFVNRLNTLLNRRLMQAEAVDVEVSIQNSARLGTYNEPEPDVALLRTFNLRGHVPTADQVLLIIEVSDVTLRKDRSVKVLLYAAAGIPEVWIVVLGEEQVEVYRKPEGGRYTEQYVLGRSEASELSTLPVLKSFSVDEVFGRPY